MGVAAQKDELLELVGIDAELEMLPATGTDGAASAVALRQVASERLAAHRRRKAAADAEQQQIEAEAMERSQQRRGGASRVREAVAARYESSVSYHEFLAQEAERALLQAQAEAEVAARNAQAVAEAQMKLLEELEQYRAHSESAVTGPVVLEEQAREIRARGDFASAMADIVEAATEAMHLTPRIEMAAITAAAPKPGLTVRLFEEPGATSPALSKLSRHNGVRPAVAQDADHAELDEEIAFRLSPEFEETLPAEPVTVSGNLIEFPRQLVAAKKARPRIAEGPLREDGAQPQLRIFEVEPEQVTAAVPEATSAPEWQSILMEHAAAVDAVDTPSAQPQYALQPLTAPVQLRLMSLAVDSCVVMAAFVGFASVVAKLAGPHLQAMPVPAMAASAVAVLGLFAVCYQVLFFTFADATPGMRYARIGLCTFGDGNPSRKAMRRRVLATLVAACPLGLGLLWAWMDEDGLGWHDRISRMYQRAY